MGTPIVFVNDPEYIKRDPRHPGFLLRQGAHRQAHEDPPRRRSHHQSDEPFHMRQRRIAAPAFHRQRINAYADQIVASAVAARDRIQSPVSPSTSPPPPWRSRWKSSPAPSLIPTSTMTSSASTMRSTLIMDLYNFIVAFPRIESLPPPPHPRHHQVPQLQKAASTPSSTASSMPAPPGHPSPPTNPDRGDLLTMLLTSSRSNSWMPKANPTGRVRIGMSDDQVRDEVLTIFLAGYETVANGLTWTWYLLSARIPKAEAKPPRRTRFSVLGAGA